MCHWQRINIQIEYVIKEQLSRKMDIYNSQKRKHEKMFIITGSQEKWKLR